MDTHDALLSIAIDLTASLAAGDRYARLLTAVRRALPCDAAAVLRLVGDELVPLAVHGLAPEVLGRHFPRREHPRLEVVVASAAPVHFPADSPLPDPFDGLLLADPGARTAVHACLGLPLLEEEHVVGVLTADALQPGAFDGLEERALRLLGALAGAAVAVAERISATERASERHRRVARDLQRDAAVHGSQILGTSAAMERVRREIDLVAPSDFSVLITGETGVGKELVARAIHAASRRREEALIYVNCAALPEAIAESELFGHVRGAFTGANVDRAGKFEVADRGTLFLDEVGELPPALQPKLLRALQQGEIQRVGADRRLLVDVRVIAATNRELPAEVAAGRFRADLYHRLAMYPLHVPPLRERREDIALLAGHFLDLYRRRLGLGPVRLTEGARGALATASWPGNVRELDHLLGRAVLRASAAAHGDGAILLDALQLQLPDDATPRAEAGQAVLAPGATRTLAAAVDDFKRQCIRQAVAQHAGNWAAAARALGLQRSNLHHQAQRLGLLPAASRRGEVAASLQKR
ncbi:MAG: nitric oxide reductase transcriptional regulator NorR [Myxococcota bacterium]|jgi:anaerobic nitric oxide reductase transcription regulator|nr:nitric oxide reductase transcriptional regulator NorR [Myxococcota bacterium]